METKKVKTLAKLKLNKLSENELEKRTMKVLKGGCGCEDACSPYTSVSSTAVSMYG
jgi:natural product precursor